MAAIDSMEAAIKADFEAGDLGEAGTFLGLEMKSKRSKWVVMLSHQQDAKRLASTYSMENVRPRGVPLNPGTTLSITDGVKLKAEKASDYTSLVGSFLCLATCARRGAARWLRLQQPDAGRKHLVPTSPTSSQRVHRVTNISPIAGRRRPSMPYCRHPPPQSAGLFATLFFDVLIGV
jgi:hypothetical protein